MHAHAHINYEKGLWLVGLWTNDPY